MEEEKTEQKLRELHRYFSENKSGLTPYQARGLDIPAPPDGIEYHNLGTIEHHVCDVIAQMMKHRKASWSIKGGGNLAKLLAAKAGKELNEVIEKLSRIVLPEDKVEEIIEVLSAPKAPKKDGKGNNGNVHKGHIPLTDCAMTGGRKALLGMFEMQGFCDLTYR